MSSGIIVFNNNLKNDFTSKYWIYFTDIPNHYFGTINAILINDSNGNPLTGEISGRTYIDFTFDYTGNTQGGRIPNTDVNYTAVSIGLNDSRYYVITGIINSGNTNIINLESESDFIPSSATSGTSGTSGINGSSGSSGSSGYGSSGTSGIGVSGSSGTSGIGVSGSSGTSGSSISDNELIGFVVDNGLNVISTGSKGFRMIGYDCIITGWTIFTSSSGSCEVEIKISDYDNFPFFTGITNGNYITLNDIKNMDYLLTGWYPISISNGSILEFYINSVTGLTNLSCYLKIKKL